MIFKINTRLNRLIRIAAILELIIVLIYDLALMMNKSEGRLINYLSIAGEILSFTLLLYIISVLNFFKERNIIGIAFFIYMIAEFAFSVSVVILFLIPSSAQFGLTSVSILGVLVLFAALFIFIMSFFIQNQFIFQPLLLYSGSLASVLISIFLITTVFPLIDPKDAGSLHSILLMRKAINWVSLLSTLAPLAVILLTVRVNQFILNQQAVDM